MTQTAQEVLAFAEQLVRDMADQGLDFSIEQATAIVKRYDHARESAGLVLWQRYFREVGHNPFQEDDYGRSWCAFCSGREAHDADCIYVAAERLVAEGIC